MGSPANFCGAFFKTDRDSTTLSVRWFVRLESWQHVRGVLAVSPAGPRLNPDFVDEALAEFLAHKENP
jgi:hypothetical protein